MPRFGLFVPESPELHVNALSAIAKGLDACGASFRVYQLNDGYRSCDLAVTFGVAKAITARGRAVGEILAAHQARHGAGMNLVMERGFIHRKHYYMLGWGGLNGRADFRNSNSPPDRWLDLDVNLQPWRPHGNHVLVCGQVPWDASVQHTNHAAWCQQTVQTLLETSQRPVRFRPHPLQKDAVDMNGLPVEISQASTLQEDLEDAWAVITFNSNAGVEATLGGVPAFAADRGAMGYSILNKDLSQIEDPCMPDRQQWLYDLAYTQWTLDEIAQGKAIQHLWYDQRNLLDRVTVSVRRWTDGLRRTG